MANSDLIPETLSLSTHSVTQGGSMTVYWTMLNQGAGTAPATTTGIRITTSSTSPGNASNDVGSVSTQQLTSGSSVSQSDTITVPANETTGTDYVWVVADNKSPATGNQGSNTGNDYQLAGSIQVSAPTSYSDLIPETLSLSTHSVTQGGSMTVYWTMLNQGAGTAPATTTGIRITTSSTSPGNASNDVGSVSTQQLTSGSSVSQSDTITVPANETTGTDYVWVVADNKSPATGNQGSNTGNDYQLAGSIQVSAPTSTVQSWIIPTRPRCWRPLLRCRERSMPRQWQAALRIFQTTREGMSTRIGTRSRCRRARFTLSAAPPIPSRPGCSISIYTAKAARKWSRALSKERILPSPSTPPTSPIRQTPITLL